MGSMHHAWNPYILYVSHFMHDACTPRNGARKARQFQSGDPHKIQ